MRDLHIVLPTVAPDYSGAASALYELGGAVVIHDPSGCLGNFVGYDEPRAYDMRSRVYTSALDEMQALLGKDDAFIYAACQAHAIAGGRFVAIIGTPNPMILGTDYDALARIVGERCGVPAFAVHTTGLASYETGASKAFLAYAKHVLAPAVSAHGDVGTKVRASDSTKGTPRVNLLGATPLDLQSQANIDVATSLLQDAGYEVASCWSMGPLSDPLLLAEGAGASCNVVLSYAGLALAAWLRRTYGTPFVWGTLSGERACGRFLDHLASVVAGQACDPLPSPIGERAASNSDAGAHERSGEPTAGPRALVVADQVLGESMRRALEEDAGYAQVDLASLFACDAKQMRPGDVARIDEASLARMIRGNSYDLVVGDGLLRGFADHDTQAAFVEVPHAAVSSRISWGKAICPYGAGFLEALGDARPAGEHAGTSEQTADVLVDPRLLA